MTNEIRPQPSIYRNGCEGYFSSHDIPTEIGLLQQSDGIDANHPQYTEFERCWQVMRHSTIGESAIRENALLMDYIELPPSASEENGCQSYCSGSNLARHHYINKAHYIEVVPRILDEVEGRIFSKPYKYSGPTRLNSILDFLDSEGLNFEQYIRWCVREVFAVSRFGVLVDWDEPTNTPIFKRYVAESIVNWDTTSRGELAFVVLEDEVRNAGQVFSHNKTKRRISFTVEQDELGQDFVVQRTWLDISGDNTTDVSFVESEEPIALSRNGFAVTQIPFIFFGGVKPTNPMLKPLASSALDYFDAHASYRHALWVAANEQPYITFDGGEGREFGFIGIDGQPINGEVNVAFGSPNPIVMMNGKICLLYTSPSPRDQRGSRMPSSA